MDGGEQAQTVNAPLSPSELRRLFDDTMASNRPHVEKLTVAAAVVSEVLRLRGMQATLVGGGAIEFYASEAYTTTDIDLVVEGKTRGEIDAALTEFGFQRRGRHWVLGDVFVEVPGNWMPDPAEVVAVGSLSLRVVRREVVLADRIVGFKHWRATAYGAQAVALLALFGNAVDETMLRTRLRKEGAEDALDLLLTLSSTDETVSEERLRELLAKLHRAHDSAGEQP